MWATRKRVRIPLRIRALATALVPAMWAFAAFAMSPAAADVALADGPTAAKRSAGVIYGGMTSNGWPVIVEVTRDGRLVKRVVGGMSAPCSLGGRYTFPSQWRDLRISRAGAISASYQDTDVDEGVEVTYEESFAAKFNRERTRVTGKWRASTTFRMPDGSVDVCDTGSLRFTAQQ
jgi:hypothetical protein